MKYRVLAEVDAERIDRDKLHRFSAEFRAAVCWCRAVTRVIGGQTLSDAHVHTANGPAVLQDGHWLVRGVTGGFFTVEPEVFTATYEPVGR